MTRQLVNSVESDDDTESTTSPVVNNNDKRHRLAEAFATIIEVMSCLFCQYFDFLISS